MNVSATVTGIEAVRAFTQQLTENASNLAQPLRAAGDVALESGQQRIDQGGPGWEPNVSGTPLLRRSGKLYSSLIQGGAGNVFSLQGNSITVGTEVTTADGKPYAVWMQGGTGVFGPSGARITPKNASALVFYINGVKQVRKSVAGSPKRPFLYVDAPLAEKIGRVFTEFLIPQLQAVS